MKLKRTKQCSKCPWKVSVNASKDVPFYCEAKHRENLKETIAVPGALNLTAPLKSMACHHSNGSDQMYCVGWLKNQLGDGNNIPLRLHMRHYENAREIKVYGEQHENFEDTLPKYPSDKS